MPAASLGPDNPLPSLGGCLPYRLQNLYNRDRKPRAFKSAVLENDFLRATFLPELGGRLWSLIHKPSGRELLYCNPVFQPGALAVCNAWFSGGVEWNCCTGGHTPLTCSPLFAARVAGPNGTPILRLYEFERKLKVPYQLDVMLPDNSPWLFVRVKLTNPTAQPLEMYWWSNIAVPETPDLRVLAPADGALRWSYDGKMDRIPMPYDSERNDFSYPVNSPGSADFFWDIPQKQRKWEAALDGEGRGLIHASTAALSGRKLFVWGMGPGGRHWQEFLSVPGQPYIEIQGGLMPTQGQKLPMAQGSEIAWVEAYGLMEADPKLVHGADWNVAWRDVDDRLERLMPSGTLDRALTEMAPTSLRAPDEMLFRGSGWGALEDKRRGQAGEAPMHSEALVFDDYSLGPDQAPWLELLRRGALPESDAPVSWMTQVEWQALLENARKKNWLTHLHLGVIYYQAGHVDRARKAWDESLALRPSAWAWRCLAMAERHDKRLVEAADLWLKSYRIMPGLAPLAVECCQSLIDAGRSGEMLALLDEMPDDVRRTGRISLLEAKAALATDDLERVEAILYDATLTVANVFEGELSLSDTWYGLHEKRISRDTGAIIDDALRERVKKEFPPPKNLDFRMAAVKRK